MGSTRAAGRWTTDEHKNFLRGVTKYGESYNNSTLTKIRDEFVPTRKVTQIKTHMQKYLAVKAAKGGQGREQRGSPQKAPQDQRLLLLI